ncbi:unnamed protein product [Thelazia callipaeda]|uniref:BTB domain-containing protein n=1 Tax=Thelazia callipaeda TaxID=103827 RepID=A0A158RCP1_THECL|nr:unnamed protein product [Thelazia callipaeda]
MVSTSLIRNIVILSPLTHCIKYRFSQFVSTCVPKEERRQLIVTLSSFSVPRCRLEQSMKYHLQRRNYCVNNKNDPCLETKFSDKEVQKRSASLVAKESTSSLDIVEQIVAKLQANGKSFILPINDSSAMEALAKPFKILLNIGIREDFIVDSCICVPELFTSLTRKGDTSIEIIEIVADFCQFTYEDAIRFFATYSKELLSSGAEEIQKCLEVLESYGFIDEKLGKAVLSCPALLFCHKSDVLSQNAENLFSYFNKNQFYSLLNSSPELLLSDTREAELIIEYIYCHMLMEGEDFAGCKNLAHISLNEVMDRHQFLLKTGSYKTPDPKRPQLRMENPTLKKILNSNAKEFAEKIACVSLSEWNLFQELQNKRRELQAEDKRFPFERIKPSMRKRSERDIVDSNKLDGQLHQKQIIGLIITGETSLFAVYIYMLKATKLNVGVMLNQSSSSSSSTKNYIDVCGEINESSSTATVQQRLLSGNNISRQLKQEESIVTAAASSTCVITSDTPNMSSHDEAGCMASLFQTPPWASMAILPPHNLPQQQGGVTREVVGSTNHPLAMRYHPNFDGTAAAAAAAAAKDPMNAINAPLYQVSIFDNYLI